MRRGSYVLLVVLVTVTFSGCLEQPTGSKIDLGIEFTSFVQDIVPPEPIPIPDIIRGLEHLKKADVPTGAGIHVLGHYAYVPARESGFFILDIAVPTEVQVVANLTRNETFYVRYVEAMVVGERVIVVGAGQATGMHFIDVTVPTEPEFLGTLQFSEDRQPSHNVAVVAGTTLVYNAPSTGSGGVNHIVDVADPDDPQVVGTFGDHGCHLIDVRMDLHRAYCAGVQESQIFDVTDPLKPVLIARVDHPLIDPGEVPAGPAGSARRGQGLHHQAIPSWNGKLLMITDEFSGGGDPGSCLASANVAATGSLSTPLGAVWFFDVSDEKSPRFLSWFSPPAVTPRLSPTPYPLPNCTGHIGRLVPDRDQVLFGWYTSGVVLIDFKDPGKPYMVNRWNEGTNTWDVEIYQGYVFTGDIARGLDVLKFV